MFFSLTPDQISSFNDKLIPLIAHDRAGFGGALISEGFLLLTIALWGYREGAKWIWWTLALGGLPGFLTGVGTHFMIGYDNHFHLSPAYLLFVFYLVGLVYSYSYLNMRGERRTQNISKLEAVKKCRHSVCTFLFVISAVLFLKGDRFTNCKDCPHVKTFMIKRARQHFCKCAHAKFSRFV